MAITLEEAIKIVKNEIDGLNATLKLRSPLELMPIVTEYSKGWEFGFGCYQTGRDLRTNELVEVLVAAEVPGCAHFVSKDGKYQEITPKRRDKNSPVPLPLFPDEKGKEIDISYCTNPRHTRYQGQKD